MDVPSLPPLPFPDGHNANDNAVLFLIRQYVIKGVQNLLQELRSHVVYFFPGEPTKYQTHYLQHT